MNSRQLFEITNDRQTCIDWSIQQGLLPARGWCRRGKHTIEMGKVNSSDVGTCVNREFRCRRKCGERRQTVAENTWFENHKISMEDVLFLTYCFVHNLSYSNVKHEIRSENRVGDISDETISDLFSFCREILTIHLDQWFETEGKLGVNGKYIIFVQAITRKWVMRSCFCQL